ncbi:decarboxylating 6-phosphogluconate dehydrogenase [Sphingopyxis sp. SE2]|uniref:phosphogluconate dehydrogenase (NAD(+)-dependent, decarboxylating) n=1 Tax=Sphingopyxis sp. SE2 TaxID=1586240 RepID=UPI0028C2B805|nr:decarboxylating 6-phosphogluconate dehydrogenase [Sphingopyxis sp. SE2]MDT7527760.1 decarboxylating 6-phosphogluconate dehydrogenase [Sphingopyxis sp. SE2]
MEIGLVGLGRMGANIARRLMAQGHRVVAYDHKPEAVEALVFEGAEGAGSLADLRSRLENPATIWLMLPAGEATEQSISALAAICPEGDVLIDGGNSHFKDDIRRARLLAKSGISYIDVGTSGGIFGRERGYCLMIGGDTEPVERLDPIFRALAPGLGMVGRTPGRDGHDPRAELGYVHAGPAGAGHFVKMVHNGIEYGMMQAFAEGFDILKSRSSERLPAEERYDLDLTDIAEVWRRGSVVSSWLLDLCAEALAHDRSLERFSGLVPDSGEGQWTIEAAMEEAVPAHVLTAALYARYRSRVDHTFGEKLLSAMRKAFGGHSEVAS